MQISHLQPHSGVGTSIKLLALDQELEHYQAAIIHMAERITRYKSKVFNEDLLDKDPKEAAKINRTVNEMEGELNTFYSYQQCITTIVRSLLEEQQQFIEKHIHELEQAKREAAYWKSACFWENKLTCTMTRLYLESVTNRQ